MPKIIYCTNKKSKKKVKFAFPVKRVYSLKELTQVNSSLVIFSQEFLKGRKSIKSSYIGSRVCLIHFYKADKNNLKITKQFGFHDYFSDDDKKEIITFKLEQAGRILDLHKSVISLEKHLLTKNKRIEKLTLLDPLTDCYNWRYFLNAVTREVNLSRRHLYSVSFVGIDIDHFRQVNEIYGIQVADWVTKDLVKILRAILRNEDTLARWRSDEFFIITPYLKNNDAYKVAQRIQNTINKHRFKYKSISLKIKASIGVVSSPGDSIFNTRDIVNALDKCLTVAKRRGGNTIILHSQAKLKPIKDTKKKSNLKDLKVKIDKMNTVLTRDLLEMIYAFARAIEAKDFYTGKHVEYTSEIAEKIARSLKLPHSEVDNIKHAAALHDLGKVGIDKSILIKSGPLTVQEMKVMQTHPAIAAEILREIHALRGAVPAVLYHHENFDGSGYPLGLKGEEIPLSARIVAIADVYQALTSDRSYRKAMSKTKALKIIKEESGTHFDPRIVDIFFKIVKELDAKK
tara:strand:- start:1522 stop:3063 length:1542 start_codon:yes stop_codon:yes gene_type:complete